MLQFKNIQQTNTEQLKKFLSDLKETLIEEGFLDEYEILSHGIEIAMKSEFYDMVSYLMDIKNFLLESKKFNESHKIILWIDNHLQNSLFSIQSLN